MVRSSDPGNPPVPIRQAILRNLHQCLVAEVAFDPATIPLGTGSLELGQARAAQSGLGAVGSAQAVTNFEIRPTPGWLAGRPEAGRTDDRLGANAPRQRCNDLPAGGHLRRNPRHGVADVRVEPA